MSGDTETNEAPPSAGPRASGRRNYIHVAQRIFNTPLLIEPKKLQAILHAIGPRLDVEVDEPAAGWPMEKGAFTGPWSDRDWDSYMTITQGVAVMDVSGTLVHKGRWLGSYSGMVSYDGLTEQLRMIRERDDVRALLLNVHSGGGEVAGCFDFVDELYAMRGTMPIVALAADAACSAAYAIASAADEIVVTQTGEVGSIGVVLTHMDYSKYAEKMGVSITHIHAGKDKVLGTPYKPLSDSDRRKLQAEVDALYDVFVAKVARNRGLDPDAIRATEARVYLAQEAVELGLANRVASGREVLDELITRVSPGAASRLSTLSTGVTMTTSANKPNAAAAEQTSATAEQLSTARAEGRAEGKAEGLKEGAAAATARVKTILTSAEAEGRGELASHLAYDTEMAADAAIALLAKSPKASPAAAGSPLERAMAAAGTPGVRAEDPGVAAPGAQSASIDMAAIYARRSGAK